MTDAMTRERALELLRGGPALVREWNEARRFADRLPSLSMADLSGVDLSGADLSGADLTGADLRGANLYRANLSPEDFSRTRLAITILSDADLREADLGSADFGLVNLRGADLSSADLFRTNLRGADLNGTKLLGSRLCLTLLDAIDLSLTEPSELAKVRHAGPSIIGASSLALSKGRIPPEFLRGCGLSDWEIEAAKLYDPALREDERSNILYEIHRLQQGTPIVYDSVFISHSTADQPFAEKLHADLQKSGVRCWFAPHDMQSGKKIHEQIERAITIQDRLLLILSESSMASTWVKTEIANARQKEREQKRQVLFPVGLVPFKTVRGWKLFDADSGDDSAREIREYYIPDFEHWQDEAKYKVEFDKLVKALRVGN